MTESQSEDGAFFRYFNRILLVGAVSAVMGSGAIRVGTAALTDETARSAEETAKLAAETAMLREETVNLRHEFRVAVGELDQRVMRLESEVWPERRPRQE